MAEAGQVARVRPGLTSTKGRSSTKQAVLLGADKPAGAREGRKEKTQAAAAWSSVLVAAQPPALPPPCGSHGARAALGGHLAACGLSARLTAGPTHVVFIVCQLLSRVRPSATPWTAAFQAPPSMGFSRQEYWSEVSLPSPSPEYIPTNTTLHLALFLGPLKTEVII